MLFCVLQGDLEIGRAALDNKATNLRTLRMPCNKCSHGLQHTALCSCGASQPQLSTLDALAIMPIYPGISSERGERHVRHAFALTEVCDVHAASTMLARKRARVRGPARVVGRIESNARKMQEPWSRRIRGE